jgi:hypothetical protein
MSTVTIAFCERNSFELPRFDTLTTHVYDGRDPYLHEDALLSVKPEFVVDFRCVDEAVGRTGWSPDFDFVKVRTRPARRQT